MLFNDHSLILGTATVCISFYFFISSLDIGLSQKLGKDYSSYLPSHPWLNQSCYVYANFSAENICCESINYTTSVSEIHKCAVKEALDISNRNEALSNGTRINRAYWFFNGNSRVAMLWEALAQILESEAVMESPGHVAHKSTHINLTLVWDPVLDDLPGRIQRWLKYPEERPTRLHIGHGVNHMDYKLDIYNKFGQEAAANDFKESVRKVIPALQELSKYTHISWMTSEYMLRSQIDPKYTNVWSRNNIDYYNNFLKEQLRGTNIAVMDAHVPLGELFIKSCTAFFVPDKIRCRDHVHQGKAANWQYATMFINNACNEYLDYAYKQKKCQRI